MWKYDVTLHLMIFNYQCPSLFPIPNVSVKPFSLRTHYQSPGLFPMATPKTSLQPLFPSALTICFKPFSRTYCKSAAPFLSLPTTCNSLQPTLSHIHRTPATPSLSIATTPNVCIVVDTFFLYGANCSLNLFNGHQKSESPFLLIIATGLH